MKIKFKIRIREPTKEVRKSNQQIIKNYYKNIKLVKMKISIKYITVILLTMSIKLNSQTIPVYTEPGKSFVPVIQKSNDRSKEDGTFISWYEELNFKGYLRIQKINMSGEIVWAGNGVVIDSTTGNYYSDNPDYPIMLSDNIGGVIIIYRKVFAAREDIYMKRINLKGDAETESIRLTSDALQYNYNPAAVLTADMKIAVVWENFKSGDYDIQGQLLNLDGTKIWNAGEPFNICKNPFDQKKPALVCNTSNKLFISWMDSRNHSEYVFDVYAGIIDLNRKESKLAIDGKLIFSNAFGTAMRKIVLKDLKIIPVGTHSFILTFENSYDNLFSDLKIIKLNKALDEIWTIDIDNHSIQQNPNILRMNDNLISIIWNDISERHNEVYGMIFDVNGNIIWGGQDGRRLSYDYTGMKYHKSLPAILNQNGMYYKNNTLYLTWVSKEINTLFLTSIHLSDESVFCECSEKIQEKISEGEFTSFSAIKNNLMILYQQSDYIYAALKDIRKEVSEINSDKPVLGNYPNPFNPSTKINFNIPFDGFVRLSVFDISGKLIKVLSNEFKPKGNYKIEFDGSGLASGVYFCKMESDGYVYTTKITLLK